MSALCDLNLVVRLRLFNVDRIVCAVCLMSKINASSKSSIDSNMQMEKAKRVNLSSCRSWLHIYAGLTAILPANIG